MGLKKINSIFILSLLSSPPSIGQIESYTGVFQQYDDIENDFGKSESEYFLTEYTQSYSTYNSPRPKFQARYRFNEKGKLKSIVRINRHKSKDGKMQLKLTKQSISYDNSGKIIEVSIYNPKKNINLERKKKKKVDKILKNLNWNYSSKMIYDYDTINSQIVQRFSEPHDTISALYKLKYGEDQNLKTTEYLVNNECIYLDSFTTVNDTIMQYRKEVKIYTGGKETNIMHWPLWRTKFFHKGKNKYLTLKSFSHEGLFEKKYDNFGNPIIEKHSSGKWFIKYVYKDDRLFAKATVMDDKIYTIISFEYTKIIDSKE